MYSRSWIDGNLYSPRAFTRQLRGTYWYGGKRWRSSSHRVIVASSQASRPAGRCPRVGRGGDVVKVGKGRSRSTFSSQPRLPRSRARAPSALSCRRQSTPSGSSSHIPHVTQYKRGRLRQQRCPASIDQGLSPKDDMVIHGCHAFHQAAGLCPGKCLCTKSRNRRTCTNNAERSSLSAPLRWCSSLILLDREDQPR